MHVISKFSPQNDDLRIKMYTLNSNRGDNFYLIQSNR